MQNIRDCEACLLVTWVLALAVFLTVCFSLVSKLCDSFVTPWTVADKAPLFMGFSRQEYWSGLPLPSPSENLTSTLIPAACYLDKSLNL